MIRLRRLPFSLIWKLWRKIVGACSSINASHSLHYLSLHIRQPENVQVTQACMHGPRLVVGPNNQGRYEWDQAGMHTYHAWPRTPPSPLLLFMQQGRGGDRCGEFDLHPWPWGLDEEDTIGRGSFDDKKVRARGLCLISFLNSSSSFTQPYYYYLVTTNRC